MKEFIEKLIERLEGLREAESDKCKEYANLNMGDFLEKYNHGEYCYKNAISIVNQLAGEYKPKTNADQIRSMNDEELAGLTITYNDYCGEYYCSDEERYDSYEDAIKHEIEWLQSEAE